MNDLTPAQKRSLVIELAKLQIGRKSIADCLGLDLKKVHNYIQIAREKGEDIPAMRPGRPAFVSFKINLPEGSRDYFEEAAALRKISVDRLCDRLLRTVARDHMISAVLDDGIHEVELSDD